MGAFLVCFGQCFSVNIEGVSTSLALLTLLERRDGEQKLSISKRRRTLYGRVEIGNKNQKISI